MASPTPPKNHLSDKIEFEPGAKKQLANILE
jgi:hypothetical protein